MSYCYLICYVAHIPIGLLCCSAQNGFSLCSMLLFGGSYPPWVRRSAHCKPPPHQHRAATGSGSHQWRRQSATSTHPTLRGGSGQHKQTTSWAGRSLFGFLLVETVKRATSSDSEVQRSAERIYVSASAFLAHIHITHGDS